MKNSIQNIKLIALAVILSFGLNLAYAWVVPAAAPPGGNAAQPITTAGGQIINGNLTIKGTAAKPATLDVASLTIDGVAPKSGEVLAFTAPTASEPAKVKWAPVVTAPSIPTATIALKNPVLDPIGYGGSTTLEYSSTNATACTASSFPAQASWSGSITPTGGALVTQSIGGLTSNTTFWLECQDAAGVKSSKPQATIKVTPKPTVTVTLSPGTFSPMIAPVGGQAGLSWSSTDATSCVAKGGSGTWLSSFPGSVSGYLGVVGISNSPVTYTVECTGIGGTGTGSVVGTIPMPVITYFKYTGSMASGFDYTWTSTNATRCDGTGKDKTWAGSKPPSGTQHETDFNMTISCTGPAGTVNSGNPTKGP